MQLIDTFAAMSDPECEEGVRRLGYTQLERDAHAYFAAYMRERGLTVETDAAGNTIAQAPGQGAALGVGSHLDSVDRAGRFDGVAGVVTAMLVADRLVREEPHRRPWRFVVFATEEGARFGQACLGSRFAAGLDVDPLLVDASGTTLAEAMSSVGLRPADAAEAEWDPADWSAFVELHVEQGPALADAGVPLGVVEAISGSIRFEVVLTGTASHSGATPMSLRADALTGASEYVLACENTPVSGSDTRVTVGRLTVTPNGITTIPGRVELSVDVRDTDPEWLSQVADELQRRAHDIARARGLGVEIRPLARTEPARLAPRVIDALRRAAGSNHQLMVSGASHDAQNIASITDAGLVFVPSLNGGVSHSPDELSRADDLERGVEVVYRALRLLDAD